MGYNSDKAVREKSTSTETVKQKIVSQTDMEKSQEKNDSTESESGDKGACHKQCDKHESDKCDRQEPEKQCDEQEPKQCDKPVASSGLSREPVHDFDELVKEVKRLVGLYSVEDVKKALVLVEGAKVN